MTAHLVLAALAATDPLAAAGVTNARVLLSGQRAAFEPDADPPRLVFQVLAKNTLSVPIDRVEIGVLFAAGQGVLESGDPGVLYRSPPEPPRDIGVVRRQVAETIPGGAEAPLSLAIILRPGDPSPQVFRTHILGYRLAAATPDLLFELLDTEVPADEAAAVDTLALAGDSRSKHAARQRFGTDAPLVAAMVTRLRQDVSAPADHRTTMAWIYAIRALGVLGGPLALATLEPLLDNPRLAAFDDGIQVMRIARAQATRLEVPLAYALPPQARRMQDVVAAALADASSLDVVDLEEEAASKAAPVQENVLEQPGERVPAWAWGALTGAVMGTAVFFGLRFVTRRREG